MSKISRCGGANQREKSAAKRPESEFRCGAVGLPAEYVELGAGDGNRTHDTQLGKLMFYH